jgi:alkylated DNA repair dioxygenase AlkB
MSVSDLFGPTDRLEKILMPDADVSYLRQLDLGDSYDLLLRELIDNTPWRAETVVIWGKSHPQPRLIAWYGDKGSKYTYSGISLEPLEWTNRLRGIKVMVENVSGATFNSVLLNYYRDHRDSMGPHSDDERELGDRPVIASLSLGEERTLTFKHKLRTELKPVRVPLASGSLLLMKGDTQRFWKHGINKQSQKCGPRINLTFRRIFE